jgi:PAS domain S-box-containing protein
MAPGAPSLLSFLEAPVLVGDPDGRAAYVNPAFEARFGVTAEGVTGQPLAVLFDGGLREAMLRAVAEACERGTTARFHLRHAGVGYAAVASPIVAEDARVGVVVVLVENSATDERMHALGRRIHEACGELDASLARLVAVGAEGEAVGVAREAHAKLRRADAELQATLLGRAAPAPAPEARFDPARVVAEVGARVRAEIETAGGRLDLRLPAELPAARGEPARLAAALAEFLRERGARAGARLIVAARPLEKGVRDHVVISVLEPVGAPAAEPLRLRMAVEELGGQLRGFVDPSRGRTIAFRLPVEAEAASG